MAGSFTVIDLPSLPFPGVVETLDFESILQEMIADLRLRSPSFTALVESDPAYKVLEVAAYRELILRQRINEAAKAVMVAFAKGSDLDQIAARYNVKRLVIDEGDPSALPPVAPTLESDDEFRARIPLSLEGYTTAGSEGGYVYHALSADGNIKDAAATSNTPGRVNVYVLSRDGDGSPDENLLSIVETALNDEKVRPMTDSVSVVGASIIEYTVDASLTLYPGPDPSVVLQAAQTAVEEYTSNNHRIGYDISVSGIMRALHQPGVQSVTLNSPAENIVVDDGQAPYCTNINVTLAGTDV